MVLGTAPETRQGRHARRVVRQRHQQPGGRHRPQRGDRKRAARARVNSPQCQRIEITSTPAGTFATFVGLTDAAGKPVRSGFADPNLRPQIVGVFTDMTGPAPPGLQLSATIDTRFSTTPNDAEAHRDAAGDRGHRRRAGRAVAAGPAGRPPDAPAHPGQLEDFFRWTDATVIVAFLLWHVIGRELVGRRLHPGDGPRRRPRRLHVQLLPLVRQPGGPVRLVLQLAWR